MDWLESIFRFLFAWIDKLIAWAIEQAYTLFSMIADTNIFDEKVLTMFSQRVYALLAIFMLFKLAFSLINYVINPDDFTEKGKGAGKLITNIFIVLLLIVSVPTIFKVAYDLQGMVIKNNVIQKVVLGVGTTDNNNVSPGKIMAFTVYSAFVTPNPDYPNMTNSDGTGKCDTLYSKMEVTPDCADVVRTAARDDGVTLLTNAVNQYDAQSLLSYDLVVNAKTNGKFLFNYTPIISSICAGIVAWIILLFCIDISIRVVKLGFLQLISPIPIISYVDPKSSKEGMFKKWTKVCASTYLDLFVRLAAISFAIFIINIIGAGKMTKISDPTQVITFATNPFVKIFILLGALLFAKQIPKLIEDLTGLKMSGAFTLNPMKKIGESPFATAALGGAVGAGAGAIGAFQANRAIGKGGLRSALGGVGGLFAGGARGMAGGLKSDGKGNPLSVGLGAGAKSGASVLKREGTTFGSRMSAGTASALGLNTQADIQDSISKQYEEYAKSAKAVDSRAEAEVLKKDNMVKNLKNNIDVLKNSGATAAQITAAETTYFAQLKAAKEQYITDSINRTTGTNGGDDAIVRETISQMNALIEKGGKNGAFEGMGVSTIGNGGEMKTLKDTVEQAELTLKGSDSWSRAHKSRDAVSKKK